MATTEELVRISAQSHEIIKRVGNGSLDPTIVRRALQGIVENKSPAFPIGSSFSLTVNYEQILDDMLEEARFDTLSRHVSARNFPHKQFAGFERLNGVLHRFGRTMTTSQVLQILEIVGQRPATAAEVINFARENPEAQRYTPVAALGQQISDDGAEVVVLWCDPGGKRICGIHYSDRPWDENFAFLAIQ